MKDRKRIQQIEQEASGKLIEENHNGRSYSLEYLNRAISHYMSLLCMRVLLGDPVKYIVFFQRSCRKQFQTLLLHWDLEKKGKTWEYRFFKCLLEDYYDHKGENLYNIVLNKFREFGLC